MESQTEQENLSDFPRFIRFFVSFYAKNEYKISEKLESEIYLLVSLI